jgi:hypothetical protein
MGVDRGWLEVENRGYWLQVDPSSGLVGGGNFEAWVGFGTLGDCEVEWVGLRFGKNYFWMRETPCQTWNCLTWGTRFFVLEGFLAA